MNQQKQAQIAVDAATQCPFLIAAFRVEQDGTLTLKRVTDKFPYAKVRDAIDLLITDLKKEAPWVFENGVEAVDIKSE